MRTSEGFCGNFGPGLIARIGEEAPSVRLRFVQKANKDCAPFRAGIVGQTGVVGETISPEVRAQALFRDRFIGVVRKGHPSGTTGEITFSLLWHPRMDADPANRWLRGCVRDVCEGQRTPIHRHAEELPKDNKKALDFPRAFELIRMVPDYLIICLTIIIAGSNR